MAKNEYLVGRTMAGEAPRVRKEELARLALKKKRQRRKALLIFFVLAIMVVLGVAIARYVMEFVLDGREEAVKREVEPTVEVIDENAGGNVSLRVKEFVARLEEDVKALHYRVERVVLPYQMARQLNVYIEGRAEYYKLSIDRGSAVQAEDIVRMAEYLEEKGISCDYVDLRVEGKAFYR